MFLQRTGSVKITSFLFCALVIQCSLFINFQVLMRAQDLKLISLCVSINCILCFIFRWGNTPLDEGRMCGSKNLIKLLEDTKSIQLPEFPHLTQQFTGIATRLELVII